LKAERATIERAIAEAHERTIEKSKVVVDAKGRMERFRSSFNDASKTTNHVSDVIIYIGLLHSNTPKFYY
jgi:predicted  nucleic acid-binding Zn-ribbon protein